MNYEDRMRAEAELKEKIFSRVIKGLKYAGLAIVGFIAVQSSYFTTSEGYLYYVQNKVTGNSSVYSEPGIHLKLPFFTNIYEYKRVATIDATSRDGNYTRKLAPVTVTFADTYTGTIPISTRFNLPVDEENFRKVHQEFRNFNNLVDALLVPNATNATVVTATQYTGEEFMQGGVNRFKSQLEDQLRNGLYVTERRQVEIDDVTFAGVSSQNSDATKLEERKRLVWKNVIIDDPKTGQPKRLDNPLSRYGIVVSQVLIPETPEPDKQLNTLLNDKRERVGQKITAIQEIETNQAKAQAATQEREIEKQKAIQEAQKTKELAIIAQIQEVEVERQRAQRELVQKQKEKDVALIQKQKELEIAQADRDIQKAAAEAAQFQAKAIKEVGLAQAEVDQAKLQAKQTAKDIYMAELQRDIANVMYPALKGVNIQMPQMYVTGGQDDGKMNTLDLFATLATQDLMKKNVAPQ